MGERAERLRGGLAALNRGEVVEFGALFATEAQWLGVPGTGFDGETPT